MTPSRHVTTRRGWWVGCGGAVEDPARVAGGRRHPVGPVRGRDRQEPVRRRGPDHPGLAAARDERGHPRRDRPAGPARAYGGRLAGGDRLRGRPRHDELGDLPVLRPDPPRDRGDHRVPRPADPRRRRQPPAARPGLGAPGRGRRRPARARARRAHLGRRRVRAARGGRVGGVHPAQRLDRAPLAGPRRAGRGQRGRDPDADAVPRRVLRARAGPSRTSCSPERWSAC